MGGWDKRGSTIIKKHIKHLVQTIECFINLFLSGCVAEMRNLGKSNQICDGVVDCPDFSDELYCPYCPEHHFHCGVGKMCVPKDKMCDGIVDCDNGADEKGCCKNLFFHKGHLISRYIFGAFICSFFGRTEGTKKTFRN